jgi:hypothetical protein
MIVAIALPRLQSNGNRPTIIQVPSQRSSCQFRTPAAWLSNFLCKLCSSCFCHSKCRVYLCFTIFNIYYCISYQQRCIGFFLMILVFFLCSLPINLFCRLFMAYLSILHYFLLVMCLRRYKN